MTVAEISREEELQEWRDFTLTWVNEQRKALKMPTLAELPAGTPHSAESCVVARALSNGWKASTGGRETNLTKKRRFWLTHRYNHKVIEHPGEVVNFIVAYDSYHYPDLVVNAYDNVRVRH